MFFCYDIEHGGAKREKQWTLVSILDPVEHGPFLLFSVLAIIVGRYGVSSVCFQICFTNKFTLPVYTHIVGRLGMM